ncbi:hypothetical protein CLV97_12110 [Planifilum fimeticola]|uniref:DinB family protein n=2 Tax=Planifilum fimeticola TaxID=201975 RepID=A0A2T0LCF1_9BACL|nr:hypothetical protein CLV97_12110 [Planifilum fimeticola]
MCGQMPVGLKRRAVADRRMKYTEREKAQIFERMKSMSERNAVQALVDEHERVLRHLMAMMNRWPGDALDRPVKDFGTVRDLMVHIVDSLFAYFQWVREKLELEENVSPPLTREALNRLHSPADWERAISLSLPYCREATAGVCDDDLGRAFPASWNEREIYMVEQMLEHAIVHVWRHVRQLEGLGL